MKTRGDKAPPKERFSPSMEIEKPQSDRSKPASRQNSTQPPPAAAATIRIKPPIADSNGLYSKLEATLARLKQNNEREATVGGWTIKVHGRTNQSAGGTHCCFIDPADSERITTLRRLREKLGGQVTAATPLAGHQGQHKRSRTASLAFFLNRKEPKEQQQQQQAAPTHAAPKPSKAKKRKLAAAAAPAPPPVVEASEGTTGASTDEGSPPPPENLLPNMRDVPPTIPLADRYRPKLSGRPIVFYGDSIAEELGYHFLSQGGFSRSEVIIVAKAGAVPKDIKKHLDNWLEADNENINKLRGAGLLVVCGGKNLVRTTPTLIGSEVDAQIAKPLKRLLGGISVPVLLVEPLTREGLTEIRDGPPQAASLGAFRAGWCEEPIPIPPPAPIVPSNNERERVSKRVAARSTDVLPNPNSIVAQTHTEMASLAAKHGFIFCSTTDPLRLAFTDFRDNLHLHEKGYQKMADELLLCWGRAAPPPDRIQPLPTVRADGFTQRSGPEKEARDKSNLSRPPFYTTLGYAAPAAAVDDGSSSSEASGSGDPIGALSAAPLAAAPLAAELVDEQQGGSSGSSPLYAEQVAPPIPIVEPLPVRAKTLEEAEAEEQKARQSALRAANDVKASSQRVSEAERLLREASAFCNSCDLVGAAADACGAAAKPAIDGLKALVAAARKDASRAQAVARSTADMAARKLQVLNTLEHS